MSRNKIAIIIATILILICLGVQVIIENNRHNVFEEGAEHPKYIYEIKYNDNEIDTITSAYHLHLFMNKDGSSYIKCHGNYVATDVKRLRMISGPEKQHKE